MRLNYDEMEGVHVRFALIDEIHWDDCGRIVCLNVNYHFVVEELGTERGHSDLFEHDASETLQPILVSLKLAH